MKDRKLTYRRASIVVLEPHENVTHSYISLSKDERVVEETIKRPNQGTITVEVIIAKEEPYERD